MPFRGCGWPGKDPPSRRDLFFVCIRFRWSFQLFTPALWNFYGALSLAFLDGVTSPDGDICSRKFLFPPVESENGYVTTARSPPGHPSTLSSTGASHAGAWMLSSLSSLSTPAAFRRGSTAEAECFRLPGYPVPISVSRPKCGSLSILWMVADAPISAYSLSGQISPQSPPRMFIGEVPLFWCIAPFCRERFRPSRHVDSRSSG